MNKFKKWQYQNLAKSILPVLKEKKYNVFYAENFVIAKQLVLDMIPHGSSIALGGSETIAQMNLYEILKSDDYILFDRYKDLPFDETVEIMRESMTADYLVTGTNAITQNGELVNMDSSGNRVAGMIFGPKKVIIVTGANKIVKNIDEAITRIKNIAPMNAKRNNHNTPCQETGYCMDCNIPDRICNYMSIIYHGMKFKNRITIIIVADEAGF